MLILSRQVYCSIRKDIFGKDAVDEQEVKRLTRRAIRTLKIPPKLWEDAEQTAWVAVLEGKKVITELSKWMRKERSHYQARRKIEGFAENHPGSLDEAEKLL